MKKEAVEAPAVLERVRGLAVLSKDCAAVPESPGGVSLSTPRPGVCLGGIEPPSADRLEDYLAWAAGASKDPSVEAVYLYDYQEERYGPSWEESFLEFRDGDVVNEASYHTVVDEKWEALPDNYRPAYMWQHWPLSKMARALGFKGRSAVAVATRVEFSHGREIPADVAGLELFGITFYMAKELLDRLQACAKASGDSMDLLVSHTIVRLGSSGTKQLAAKPKFRGSRDIRSIELAVTVETRELLVDASAEADTSNSHIIQQLVLAFCPE